jgi:hypothetical protein
VLKTHLKKHAQPLDPNSNPDVIIQETKNFLQTLEALRLEIVARDEAYAKAKHSKNSADMENYHQLARVISKKCLDYGRDLCDAPIPRWVDGNLSKDRIDITRHAYDIIRNKICASLSIFDNDLMPSAKILLDFAEGRY